MTVTGSESGRILLTGATGYVGSRLLTALERGGNRVRCVVRRPEVLHGRVLKSTEVLKGDLLDPATVHSVLEDIDTAYYLVHSMAGKGSFEDDDRRAAELFSSAARSSGVRHIVYLGGLARGPDLSSHLASRIEVGRILRESGVPTTEFRASIIIGAGSLSFEMIRALVDRLPVMITPRWVNTRAQPIAIDDVVAYLVAALDPRHRESRVYEIGGADCASYRDVMLEYAKQRGLRRLMIPVPVLTPWLSSLWLNLVTPVFAHVGRRLIEGVRNESVVRDKRALDALPVKPISIGEAIRRALAAQS